MSSQKEILSNNLKRLIESKGIDQRMLSDHLELSEMAISHWVNGKKYPRMGNVQRMADYFGVTKSDLYEDKNDVAPSTSTLYKYYPTSISAGLPNGVEPIMQAREIELPDSLLGRHAGNRDIFVTRVNGDSMDLVIPDGSLIAVKPIGPSELKNGDIVVYSDDHEYSVKYFFKSGSKIIFKPSSSNIDHHERHYDLDSDIKIHGKVVVYVVELD